MASSIVPTAQKGKRRYRCGLLRRDVAATCCEQGGYGSVWQDPCTGCCEVGFCFDSDSRWQLQDILRFLQHRSPRAFNPRVKTSTCCQMEWWIRSSMLWFGMGKIHARGYVMSNFASSLTWDGDCKTNFVSFCIAVLTPSIQGRRCRRVAR